LCDVLEMPDSDEEDYDSKKEARDYIRSFLKVENESTMIKGKVSGWKYGKDAKKDALYDLSKWDKLEQREN